ncbi:unnamed protein product [Ranitomeya imitator]|uniref:Uncharacterized protein n=1 Tax=Ranitomeya imitator TaxID=111125 RepID=A0ABN9L4U9_9NEOB|nr:unnamed protein product [Ranitomeya imitator]
MVPKPTDIRSDSQSVGVADNRSICYEEEQEGQKVRIFTHSRPAIYSGFPSGPLGLPAGLCLSPNVSDSDSSQEDQGGKSQSDLNRPLLAQEALVLSPQDNVCDRSLGVSSGSGTPLSRSISSSKFGDSSLNGLELERELLKERGFSNALITTLLKSRKEDKIVLKPDPAYLPKVATKFHRSQEIYLPSFYENPGSEEEKKYHTLDNQKKGSGVTKNSIARWIREAICLAYSARGVTPPEGIRAHSTRAMASSWAEKADVPIEMICLHGTAQHMENSCESTASKPLRIRSKIQNWSGWQSMSINPLFTTKKRNLSVLYSVNQVYADSSSATHQSIHSPRNDQGIFLPSKRYCSSASEFNAMEDVFGDSEDFTADDLEEIDIIASQAYTQDVGTANIDGNHVQGNAILNNRQTSTFLQPQRPAPPKRGRVALNSLTDNETPAFGILQSEHEELKQKLKVLQNDTVIKNGEIKVLRDALRQTESNLEQQRIAQAALEKEKTQMYCEKEKELLKKVRIGPADIPFEDDPAHFQKDGKVVLRPSPSLVTKVVLYYHCYEGIVLPSSLLAPVHKMECVPHILDEIQSLQSELQFKDVEMIELKTKLQNCERRIVVAQASPKSPSVTVKLESCSSPQLGKMNFPTKESFRATASLKPHMPVSPLHLSAKTDIEALNTTVKQAKVFSTSYCKHSMDRQAW